MSEKRDSVNQKQTQSDRFILQLSFDVHPKQHSVIIYSPTGHSKPYFLTKREMLRTATLSVKKKKKKTHRGLENLNNDRI